MLEDDRRSDSEADSAWQLGNQHLFGTTGDPTLADMRRVIVQHQIQMMNTTSVDGGLTPHELVYGRRTQSLDSDVGPDDVVDTAWHPVHVESPPGSVLTSEIQAFSAAVKFITTPSSFDASVAYEDPTPPVFSPAGPVILSLKSSDGSWPPRKQSLSMAFICHEMIAMPTFLPNEFDGIRAVNWSGYV
jgi:hypothetical protein